MLLFQEEYNGDLVQFCFSKEINKDILPYKYNIDDRINGLKFIELFVLISTKILEKRQRGEYPYKYQNFYFKIPLSMANIIFSPDYNPSIDGNYLGELHLLIKKYTKILIIFNKVKKELLNKFLAKDCNIAVSTTIQLYTDKNISF
jgi:hypothetical protein